MNINTSESEMKMNIKVGNTRDLIGLWEKIISEQEESIEMKKMNLNVKKDFFSKNVHENKELSEKNLKSIGNMEKEATKEDNNYNKIKKENPPNSLVRVKFNDKENKSTKDNNNGSKIKKKNPLNSLVKVKFNDRENESTKEDNDYDKIKKKIILLIA